MRLTLTLVEADNSRKLNVAASATASTIGDTVVIVLLTTNAHPATLTGLRSYSNP